MNKNINEMSVVELESLAYRQVVLLEQTQNNLRVLNQAIAEKSKPESKPEEVKPEEKKK